MLDINYIVNRVFNSLTYILRDEESNACWLVDCGDVEKLKDSGIDIKGVLLTHCHYDHIYGLNKLAGAFPEAKVYTNAFGTKALANPKWNFSHYHPDAEDFIFNKSQNVIALKEGEEIYIGSVKLTVLETPGHDPSCLCYKTDNAIFTGDAYIPGVKVVTSFPRSDKVLALASLQRIMDVSKEIQVYPGHKI